MPKEKNKQLIVETLRHTEYYDMQNVFDNLYARSKNGEIFTDLMDLILSRENSYWRIETLKQTVGVTREVQIN